MSISAWPVGSDLVTFLAGIDGIDAPSEAVCNILCLAAVAQFEDATGWRPFLASDTASYRRFDPPDGRSGRLRLPIQAAAVASVRIGYSPTDSGDLLVEETDYYLGPENASSLNVPYMWIDFVTHPGTLPRSVRISAKWGYRLTIPEDAYLAVLYGAAIEAASNSTNIAGEMTKIKQGEIERTFGGSGMTSTVDSWAKARSATIAKYLYVRPD